MSNNNGHNPTTPHGSSADHGNRSWRNVQPPSPLIVSAADAAYARRRGVERPFGGHTGTLHNDQTAPQGHSRHSTGSASYQGATGQLYASRQESFSSGSSRHSTGSANFPGPPQLRSHFSTPTHDGRSVHSANGSAAFPVPPPQSHFSSPTEDSVRYHASRSSPGSDFGSNPNAPSGQSPVSSIYAAYGHTGSASNPGPGSNESSPPRSGANYQGPPRSSSRHSSSSAGSGYASGLSSFDGNHGSIQSSRSGSSQSSLRDTNLGAPRAHRYTGSGSSRSG
ncbi:hypothetical protein C8T65DRAFT_739427 [Cerioporus squamosus]|nr:hypothetical protein C8T65DRAFT_739427 [Cerioporus squamosus]